MAPRVPDAQAATASNTALVKSVASGLRQLRPGLVAIVDSIWGEWLAVRRFSGCRLFMINAPRVGRGCRAERHDRYPTPCPVVATDSPTVLGRVGE